MLWQAPTQMETLLHLSSKLILIQLVSLPCFFYLLSMIEHLLSPLSLHFILSFSHFFIYFFPPNSFFLTWTHVVSMETVIYMSGHESGISPVLSCCKKPMNQREWEPQVMLSLGYTDESNCAIKLKSGTAKKKSDLTWFLISASTDAIRQKGIFH